MNRNNELNKILAASIARDFKDMLITMAVNDELPLDLNELPTMPFEKAVLYSISNMRGRQEAARAVLGVLDWEKLSLTQISEGSIPQPILKLMEGRESFKDTDESLGERMFVGDIFEQLLEDETLSISEYSRDILLTLASSVTTEYIQLTNI